MSERNIVDEETCIVRLVKQERDARPGGAREIAHQVLVDEVSVQKPETIMTILKDMQKKYGHDAWSTTCSLAHWVDDVGPITDVTDANGHVVAIDFRPDANPRFEIVVPIKPVSPSEGTR